MKFFEFIELIEDKAGLLEYPQGKGVLRRGSFCDVCSRVMGMQESTRTIDGFCFRCTKCKRTKSIRSGSFLEDFKLPIKVVAAIIYLHHMEVLNKHIEEVLDISEDSVIDCLNLMREQCGKMLIEHGQKLGGPGIRVQFRYLFLLNDLLI